MNRPIILVFWKFIFLLYKHTCFQANHEPLKIGSPSCRRHLSLLVRIGSTAGPDWSGLERQGYLVQLQQNHRIRSRPEAVG